MTGGRCQWATCTAPANALEDGWRFCSCHLAMHRAFKREDARAEILQQRRAKRGNVSLRAAVLALHTEGLPDAQIAERLGVVYDVVKRERHELGLTAHVPLRTVPGHGSHSGFNGHQVRRDEPCTECRIAERKYQRDRARRRRAAKKLQAVA